MDSEPWDRDALEAENARLRAALAQVEQERDALAQQGARLTGVAKAARRAVSHPSVASQDALSRAVRRWLDGEPAAPAPPVSGAGDARRERDAEWAAKLVAAEQARDFWHTAAEQRDRALVRAEQARDEARAEVRRIREERVGRSEE